MKSFFNHGRSITKRKDTSDVEEDTIKGNLQIIPNFNKQECKERIYTGGNYHLKDDDGQNVFTVKISEEGSQRQNKDYTASNMSSYQLTDRQQSGDGYFNKHLPGYKINKSNSFSNSVNTMEHLDLLDSRRFSCASDESSLSCTSSNTETWADSFFGDMKILRKPSNDLISNSSVDSWGCRDPVKHPMTNSADHECLSNYFGYLERQNPLQRGDGISYSSEKTPRIRSDSEFSSLNDYIRFPYGDNLENRKEYNQFDLLDVRRDSMYSNYSDRRFSGYSSDNERRDSNSSNMEKNSSQLIYSGNNLTQEHTFPLVDRVNLPQPGMEWVPEWLKSLRLHKYTNMIMNTSYEQMLELNEEKLEKLKVTKGARRKIVASIQKLKDRPKILNNIDKAIDESPCDMRKALIDLESVVKSPIKLFGDSESANEGGRVRHSSARDSGAEFSDSEDCERNGTAIQNYAGEGERLVERILETLKKACSSLFLSQNTDIKHIQMFTNLLDICLSREVYTSQHKELMTSWKYKIFSIWGSSPATIRSPNSNLSQHQNLAHFNPQLMDKERKYFGRQYNSKCEDSPQLFMNDSFNGHETSSTQRQNFLIPRKSAPNIKSCDHIFNTKEFKKRNSMQESHSNQFYEKEPSLLAHPNEIYKLPMLSPNQKQYNFGHKTRASDYNHTTNHPSGTKTNPLQKVTISNCDSNQCAVDSDLNTHIESLCLSVTEHALNC